MVEERLNYDKMLNIKDFQVFQNEKLHLPIYHYLHTTGKIDLLYKYIYSPNCFLIIRKHNTKPQSDYTP